MKIKEVLIIVGILANIKSFATSPLSLYKQFGSVAALSEVCLKSQKIPKKLNKALIKSGLDKDMINALIKAYNSGYKNAILNYKIWIASKEKWNKKSFDCSNKKDIELIKKFENKIYSNIK